MLHSIAMLQVRLRGVQRLISGAEKHYAETLDKGPKGEWAAKYLEGYMVGLKAWRDDLQDAVTKMEEQLSEVEA